MIAITRSATNSDTQADVYRGSVAIKILGLRRALASDPCGFLRCRASKLVLVAGAADAAHRRQALRKAGKAAISAPVTISGAPRPNFSSRLRGKKGVICKNSTYQRRVNSNGSHRPPSVAS